MGLIRCVNNMKNILFISITLSFVVLFSATIPSSALAGNAGSVNECILEKMPSIGNDALAALTYKECGSKYTNRRTSSGASKYGYRGIKDAAECAKKIPRPSTGTQAKNYIRSACYAIFPPEKVKRR